MPQMKSDPAQPSPPDQKGKSKKPTAEPALSVPNVVIENVAAIVFPANPTAPSGTTDVASEDTGPGPQKSAPVVLAAGADSFGAKEVLRTTAPELSLPPGKQDLTGLEALDSQSIAKIGEFGKAVLETDKADAAVELQSAESSTVALARKESKHEVATSSKTSATSTAKNIPPAPLSTLETRNEVAGGKKSVEANTNQASSPNEASPASSNSDGFKIQPAPATPQHGNAIDPSQAVSITSVAVTSGGDSSMTPISKSQQPGRDARVSTRSESSNRTATATRDSEEDKGTAPSLMPTSDALHRSPEIREVTLSSSQTQMPSSASGNAFPETARSNADAWSGATSTDSTLSRDSGLPRGIPESTNPPVMPGMVRDAHLVDTPKHTEMRIDLRTTTFGSIEVHAVIRDTHVGLSIGSERGDLHHLLSTEVPAMEGRLQRHDLQLDSVRFIEQGHAFHAGTSSGNPSKESPEACSRSAHIVDVEKETSPMVSADPDLLVIQGPGLNLRA